MKIKQKSLQEKRAVKLKVRFIKSCVDKVDDYNIDIEMEEQNKNKKKKQNDRKTYESIMKRVSTQGTQVTS